MRRVLILSALALALASCGGETSTKSMGGGAAKNYNLMTIERGSNEVVTRYSATMRGAYSTEIRPQVTGVITDILINEGAGVRKGQTLFIIDQAPFKAALDVAVANVKRAKSALSTATINAESAKELLNEKVISQNEYQIALNTQLTAEADLALAIAQESSARNDLSYTEITSPVNGVASMISYRVGSLVSASIDTPLVTVANRDIMNAYFSVSEPQMYALIEKYGSRSQLLKNKTEVSFQLNNGTIYEHKGVVDAISGTVDRTTGTVTIRASFSNPNMTLRDGANGRVLVSTTKEDVIVIPKVATFELQNKIFAYKIVDGKATSQQVTVFPINDGHNYIIESGLEVGDVIIAEGAGLVREGTLVKN
ncbi:MAG: efflux RND transporter periplasmic adaptor subunit [Rikenellaceae bacterium]